MDKEYVLKITGSCNIAKPLQLNKSYIIASEVDVYKVSESSTHSDHQKYTYACKQTGRAVIQNELGDKLKADSRSQSKKLRSQIMMLNNSDMDDADFYDFVMDRLRHKMADLLPELIK